MTTTVHAPARVAEFDILRGILVIGMVAVHVLANIGGSTPPEMSVLWISVGFVFMSGMLGGAILLKSKRKRSIVFRGAKLIGLFLLLNLLLRGPASVLNVVGHGDVTMAMFEILLPIGIVIMLLPAFAAAPGLLGGLCLVYLMALDAMHVSPYVLKFVAIGGIGAMSGALARDWQTRCLFPEVIVGGLSIVLCVLLAPGIGIVAPLTFALFLWFGSVPFLVKLSPLLPNMSAWLALLGRHSLLLYILHVAVIAAAAKLHPPLWPTLIAVLLGCTLAAWIGDHSKRFPLLHGAYRLILR